MDDDDLGRHLADALRGEADRVDIPENAWNSYRRRYGAGRQRRSAATPARAGRAARWRVPLIAAASVAVIAIATAAIVTRGSGGPAAGPSGGVATSCAQVPDSAAAVPVDAGGEQSGPANGVAGGPPAGRSATGPAASGADGTVVHMFFAGGAPPTADLCGRFTFAGGISTGGSHASDGTPLGYLGLSGGIPDGAHYLWGAVGPDILQVQVGVVLPPDPEDIDPGFSAGPNWTIDSGKGTFWSLPEAATTVWTDIGNGWHGFALLLPTDASTAHAIALDQHGTFVQDRVFDLADGTTSDTAPPSTTGSPPFASTSIPPGQSEVSAPDLGPPPATVPSATNTRVATG